MFESMTAHAANVLPTTQLEEAISIWLIDRIAEYTGSTPLSIDSTIPFADYGLGSAEAVILSGDMERWLGRRLSPMLLWDYPTIDALAQHLAYER